MGNNRSGNRSARRGKPPLRRITLTVENAQALQKMVPTSEGIGFFVNFIVRWYIEWKRQEDGENLDTLPKDLT